MRAKDGSATETDARIEGQRPLPTHPGPARSAALLTPAQPRESTEEALRESEARFQRIFDQSPIGAAVVGLDQRILRANAAFCRLLGYAEAELSGRTFRDFTHPDHLAVGIEQVERLISGDLDVYSAEKCYVRKDGSTVWGRLSTCLVKDAAGKAVCFLPMVEDIDDRRRAEAALGDKTEELERFFAVSLDLMCIHDLEGIIRRVNPAWTDTLGFPVAELVGKSLFGLVHPEDQRDTQAALEEQARGRQVLNFVNRYRHRDGSYRWLEWRSASHQAGLIYAAARDITERIVEEQTRARLEGQLRQSQKLESVGRLAGGVAHDFNNLLTCITGNLSLALLDLAEDSPLLESLLEVSKAADRAAVLTRQLLAFSRKQVVEPRVLDLNQLVQQMNQMLERLIGEDIELESVADPTLGSVRMDPGQFEQVLVNLVVNARDAMPEGGVLTIETANRSLGEEALHDWSEGTPGEYVMLAVADTGVGIRREDQPHVFEPFFTTKSPDKGTGLGLATVYGAVQQAGGRIDLESEPGRGTTFRIYLPRIIEAPESFQPERRPRSLPPGAETIVLVEDELVVRRFAERLLRRLGYSVLSFADPLEAVSAIRRHDGDIDLLITDVIMPKMNGRLLAERLALIRPDLKVLFTSGYPEDAIAQHGVLDQGIEFISKPYTASGLARKIRSLLDSE